MRAPLAPPFARATVPPLRFASDFCLFTSWLLPNEADAGRFSPDIFGVLREGVMDRRRATVTVEGDLCSVPT